MSPSELLEKALDGLDGDAIRLANMLDLHDAQAAATKFRRWGKNLNAPDYKATLILLDAAGLLRTEQDLEAGRRVVAELEDLRAQLERLRRRPGSK